MKGLSPLMASVMLIAFTLAVAALIGSWFTSMTKTETATIEKGSVETINCTKGLVVVTGVICRATGDYHDIQIGINNQGQLNLYDFSSVIKINNTFISNNTGGPNSSTQLDAGGQDVLTYGCGDTVCVENVSIESVRVSAGNCPSVWTTWEVGTTCE